MWWRLTAVAAALAAAVPGCGGQGSADELARDLRPQLQAEFNKGKLTVSSLRCQPPRDDVARCTADVATFDMLDAFGTPERTYPVPLDVTADPQTGELSWVEAPHKPAGEELSHKILPQLRSELRTQGVSVGRTVCVVPSERRAKCVARLALRGQPETAQNVEVNVTLDPDSGDVAWKIPR